MAPSGRVTWGLLVWGAVILAAAAMGTGYLMEPADGLASADAPLRPDQALSAGLTRWTGGRVRLGLPEQGLLLVTVLFSLHRYLLARLAYRPGPLEVLPLTTALRPTAQPGSTADSTQPPPTDAPVEDLTARLRQHLSALRLHPAGTPVPGEAPAERFLGTLAQSKREPTGNLAAAAEILSNLVPTHAYRVAGTLQARPEAPRCGISIHIEALSDRTVSVETFWDDSWEAVVARAAHAVGAFVLPRTRLIGYAPWRSWRKCLIPHRLFSLYQNAKGMADERRYDEALELYHEIFRMDPRNLDLRVEFASLQEQEGLALEALASYSDILALSPTKDARRSQSPKRPRGLRKLAAWLRYTNGLRTSDLFVARYRYIFLLGLTDKTASQWLSGRGHSVEQRRELNQLRDRMRERFSEWYGPVFHFGGREYGIDELFREAEERRDAYDAVDIDNATKKKLRRSYHEIRHVVDQFFLHAAQLEANDLCRDFGRIRRRISGTQLTARSVRLCALWAAERQRLLHGGDRDNLPPRPLDQLQSDINGILGKRRPSKEWLDHYSAGCIYALAWNRSMRLLGQIDYAIPDEHEREERADLAISELAMAVTLAASDLVGRSREWILTDDPDLAGLRGHPKFLAFEAQYLPSLHPSALRPPNVHGLEAGRYVDKLILEVASAMRDCWQRRLRCIASGGSVDIEHVSAWLGTEQTVWGALSDLADSPRWWKDRVALIRSMQNAMGPGGFCVAFPQYFEQVLHGREDAALSHDDLSEKVFRAGRDEVRRRDDRLRILNVHLRRAQLGTLALNGQPTSPLYEWRVHLRRVGASYAAAPDSQDIARLVRDLLAVWLHLEGWFSGLASGDAESFANALERLTPPPNGSLRAEAETVHALGHA